MKTTLIGMICRFLAVAMVLIPFQTGQASMIGTDQAVAAATATADRSTVLNFLSRSQTESELQSLGLDPQTARDRVAAMTDAEVGKLAGQIHAAPAGADGAGLLVLILVVFLVWYVAFRR